MGAGGPPSPDPLAIASLAIGAFGLITCFCCGAFSTPLALAAIGLGAFSLMRQQKEPEKYGGKPLAIAGIAVGGVGLVLMIIVTVLGMGANMMQQLQ